MLADYNKSVKEAMRNNTAKFPLIKTANQLREEAYQESRIPIKPSDRIDLRDLTWEDRERVLRLLFARINGVCPDVDETRSNVTSRMSNYNTGINNTATQPVPQPPSSSEGSGILRQPDLE